MKIASIGELISKKPDFKDVKISPDGKEVVEVLRNGDKVTGYKVITIIDGQKAVEQISPTFAPEDIITFGVRGMLPIEQDMVMKLLRFGNPPTPPKKKVEVKPLNQSGGIIASEIRDELQYDENDPDYLRELKLYQERLDDNNIMILGYQLSNCIDGFDMRDEEIQKYGGVVHAKTPIDNLRKRMTEVGKLILGALDSRILLVIQRNIDELTGISEALMDFTSRPFAQRN